MKNPGRVSGRLVKQQDSELIQRFSASLIGVRPKSDTVGKAARLSGRFGGVLYLGDCEDCITGFWLGHLEWPTKLLLDWLVVPVKPKDRCELLVKAVVDGLREEFPGVQVAVRSRYPEDQSLEFLAALKKAAKGDLDHDRDSDYYQLPDAPDDSRLPAGGGESYAAKVATRLGGRRPTR